MASFLYFVSVVFFSGLLPAAFSCRAWAILLCLFGGIGCLLLAMHFDPNSGSSSMG